MYYKYLPYKWFYKKNSRIESWYFMHLPRFFHLYRDKMGLFWDVGENLCAQRKTTNLLQAY